jgi:hypothetical protein
VDDNYLWMADENGIEIHFDASNTYVLPFWPSNGVAFYAATWQSRNYTNGEPVHFTIALELTCSNEVIYSDSVRLTVAPLILPPECHPAETVYSTTNLSITGITLLDGVAWPWTQDMVKFTRTQLSSNASQIAFVSLGSGELYDVLQNDEGHQGLGWDVNENGGNIMATPPLGPLAPYGKILVGTKHPASVPQWVNQGMQPVVTNIDTAWLYVGHVDEIVMFTATNKMLVADPWTAANLLHAQIIAGNETNTMWWGTTAAHVGPARTTTVAKVTMATNAAGQFKRSRLPAGGLPVSTNQTTIVFTNAMFAAGDRLRVNNEILKAVGANGPTVVVARAQGWTLPAAHAEYDVVYALSHIMMTNLPVGDALSVADHIKSFTNSIRSAIGAAVDFTPMPVLFDWVEIDSSVGFLAATPNLANCLVMNEDRVIMPEPGIACFKDHAQEHVSGAEFYDSWILHIRRGNIHCATAAIRELPAIPPFWEQVDSWE